jgi:general stress protein 26
MENGGEMRARLCDANVDGFVKGKDVRIYVATHRKSRKAQDVLSCKRATFAYHDVRFDGQSGHASLVGYVREVKDPKHRERIWKGTW